MTIDLTLICVTVCLSLHILLYKENQPWSISGITNRMFSLESEEPKQVQAEALGSKCLRSQVECALFCTETEACDSFDFIERSGHCSLINKVDNRTDVPTREVRNIYGGVSYY